MGAFTGSDRLRDGRSHRRQQNHREEMLTKHGAKGRHWRFTRGMVPVNSA